MRSTSNTGGWKNRTTFLIAGYIEADKQLTLEIEKYVQQAIRAWFEDRPDEAMDNQVKICRDTGRYIESRIVEDLRSSTKAEPSPARLLLRSLIEEMSEMIDWKALGATYAEDEILQAWGYDD